ncbi:pyruvate oxidase [Capsulimonas corticalis]|uniref:Pyruvate oxidase n=1 Tax=Capsulimonas corticalis TaxID=2219043 RepID=A0A402CWA4_9BACT|nr:thiamine pyrophosphate-dependent enzyme [Capsulimonas corticalis]BDI34061.1 pyruvate oxidase [Capsulimonas corticalis]
MAETVSDVFIETIMGWGVDTIFGIPGDGVNGVIEALRTRQDKIKFVQVRHEEAAAFMACAYAKYTGKLGCCLATSGPGAIHLLNGLYDAKCDQAPVLAILGQTFSDLKGSHFQQDVNLARLFDDVSVYVQELANPNQIEMLANEACRHSLNHRGVSAVIMPIDYQLAEPSGKYSMHKGRENTTSNWTRPVLVPAAGELQKAATILNAAKKPVMLVGQGALGAGDEVIALAEKLGSPVVKALLGKAVIPDDSPYTTCGLGLLGTAPSEDVMKECDAILFVGTSFPYMEFLPKHDKCPGVQIDDMPDRIGLRYPVEVGLVGDAKATLAALTELIDRKDERPLLESAQKGMKDWWELMEQRAMRDRTPIVPQRVAWELGKLAADNAIVSGDSGTNTTWVARQFKIRKDQKFSCSGTLATMAPGLPYSIAAKVAFPDRQSIAFVGDGGFTMLMGEFATAVKYGLDITVVMIKNNVLGQIKWEQIVFLGVPEYAVELHDIDFAKFAEACGGVGITVRDPNDLKPALERALSCGKAALVEVYVDPNEPPMPGHVTMSQARKFGEALVKGQPQGARIALTAFRDKISELI